MKNIFVYSFLVWFPSILPLPLISRAIYNFERNYIPLRFWEIAGLWDYVSEDLLSGFLLSLFSFPIFILFFMISDKLQKQMNTIFQLKISITILSFSLALISLIFLQINWSEIIIIPIIQTISIWILKIKPIKKTLIAREDILDEVI